MCDTFMLKKCMYGVEQTHFVKHLILKQNMMVLMLPITSQHIHFLKTPKYFHMGVPFLLESDIYMTNVRGKINLSIFIQLLSMIRMDLIPISSSPTLHLKFQKILKLYYFKNLQEQYN